MASSTGWYCVVSLLVLQKALPLLLLVLPPVVPPVLLLVLLPTPLVAVVYCSLACSCCTLLSLAYACLLHAEAEAVAAPPRRVVLGENSD